MKSKIELDLNGLDLNKPFLEALDEILRVMKENGMDRFVATTYSGSDDSDVIPYVVLSVQMLTRKDIKAAEEIIASGPLKH